MLRQLGDYRASCVHRLIFRRNESSIVTTADLRGTNRAAAQNQPRLGCSILLATAVRSVALLALYSNSSCSENTASPAVVLRELFKLYLKAYRAELNEISLNVREKLTRGQPSLPHMTKINIRIKVYKMRQKHAEEQHIAIVQCSVSCVI